MKKIKFFALAIVAAALSIQPSTAQLGWGTSWSGAQATSYTAGTNKAMALTTNAYFQIDAPKSKDVVLFCNFKFLNAPGSGDANELRVDFYRGVDPGKWETNAFTSWVIPGNSTTPRASITNMTIDGIPYLRARIANTSTNSHATNILFQYGLKR